MAECEDASTTFLTAKETAVVLGVENRESHGECSDSRRRRSRKERESVNISDTKLRESAAVQKDESPQSSHLENWDTKLILMYFYRIGGLPMENGSTHSRNIGTHINIEGHLETLPRGRRKGTFWNAWKRRYFKVKNGYISCYQNRTSEKASFTLSLKGARIDLLTHDGIEVTGTGSGSKEGALLFDFALGIEDEKGHYLVVRLPSSDVRERWYRALESQIQDDEPTAEYVCPVSVPKDLTLFTKILLVDIGTCSSRAGVLSLQPTYPQLFFPSAVSGRDVVGLEALMPKERGAVRFPLKATALSAGGRYLEKDFVQNILQHVCKVLSLQASDYELVLSIPCALTHASREEILKVVFDIFKFQSVCFEHQTILCLRSYNSSTGIVVDIGERMDIVPVAHGYILEAGVSRVPYGGSTILNHLQKLLIPHQPSLNTATGDLILRYILEEVCYNAMHYNQECERFQSSPLDFQRCLDLEKFFQMDGESCRVLIDDARFLAPEGLFNPKIWGLDNQGVPGLVHKALQESSIDVRKELSRSIYLSGGVSLLAGFRERLNAEINRLLPQPLAAKVHASPHRYHAAFLGAGVLASGPSFSHSRLLRDDWLKGVAIGNRWSC